MVQGVRGGQWFNVFWGFNSSWIMNLFLKATHNLALNHNHILTLFIKSKELEVIASEPAARNQFRAIEQV
jgi:hypothetical protein